MIVINKIIYSRFSRPQSNMLIAKLLVVLVLCITLITNILLVPFQTSLAKGLVVSKLGDIKTSENLAKPSLTAEVIEIETSFSEGDFFEINNPYEVWRVVERGSKNLIWKNQDGIVMETYNSIILPPILELHPNGKMVSREISKLAGDLNLDRVSKEDKLYGRLSFTVVEKFNQQPEEWKLFWVCESRGLTKVITNSGIRQAAKIYCLRNSLDEVVFYYSKPDQIVIRIERSDPKNGQKISREIVNWKIAKQNKLAKKTKQEIKSRQNYIKSDEKYVSNNILEETSFTEGKISSYSFSQQIPQSQGNVYNKYYSGEESISPDSSDKIYDANKSLFKARIITIEPFADPISRTPREDDPEILRNKARGIDLSGYDRTVDLPHVNPSEVYPDGYYDQNLEAQSPNQVISQRINLADTSQRRQPQFNQNSIRQNTSNNPITPSLDGNYLSNQDPLFQSRYPNQTINKQQLGQNVPVTGNNQDFRSNPIYQRGFAEGYNQAQNLRGQQVDSFQLGLDASAGYQGQAEEGSLRTNLAVDQASDAPIAIGLPSSPDENLSFKDSNLSDVVSLSMEADPDFFSKHLNFIKNTSEAELRDYLPSVEQKDGEDLISLFDTIDSQPISPNPVSNNNKSSNTARNIALASRSQAFNPNSKDYFDNINQVYSFTGRVAPSSNLNPPRLSASLPSDFNFNNARVGSVAAHLASYVVYSNLERGWMIYQQLYNGLLQDYDLHVTEIVLNGQKYYRLFAKANNAASEVINLCRSIVTRGYYCLPRRI